MYYFGLDSEMVRMFSGLLTSGDHVRLPRHQKDQNLQPDATGFSPLVTR